jgi:hypothetical protein
MRGLISGLPETACAAGMARPQLEQKRAPTGNPVPHWLQKIT